MAVATQGAQKSGQEEGVVTGYYDERPTFEDAVAAAQIVLNCSEEEARRCLYLLVEMVKKARAGNYRNMDARGRHYLTMAEMADRHYGLLEAFMANIQGYSWRVVECHLLQPNEDAIELITHWSGLPIDGEVYFIVHGALDIT